MATDTRSLLAFFNTDADFRAWATGIAAQLVAAGMVKTSDTGQIDLTTVAKPAATNTAQGYEVYRFNDSLQATLPIYFKIEYGSGGAVDRPSLWITVGTSTNGAGTIGGQASTRFQVRANSSKSAAAVLNSYCSGDGGRVALCNNLDPSSNSFSIGFMIDRPRDSSGTALAVGYFVQQFSTSGGPALQIVPDAGSVPSQQLCGLPLCPPLQESKSGTQVALCAPQVCLDGHAYTSIVALCYTHADIGELTPFVATFLGSSHTWLPLGDGIQSTQAHASLLTPAVSMAFLWE